MPRLFNVRFQARVKICAHQKKFLVHYVNSFFYVCYSFPLNEYQQGVGRAKLSHVFLCGKWWWIYTNTLSYTPILELKLCGFLWCAAKNNPNCLCYRRQRQSFHFHSHCRFRGLRGDELTQTSRHPFQLNGQLSIKSNSEQIHGYSN